MELDNAFWADIGEIVSGFAVVVTLAILVYEIRKNTESNRAISYGQALDRLNHLRQLVIEQPALAKAIERYFGDEYRNIDGDERQLIGQYLASQWSTTETAYFYYHRKVFGQSEWRRFEQTIPIHYKFAVRAGAWKNLRNSLTGEFADYVENFCAE
jgi:hypothetical protein